MHARHRSPGNGYRSSSMGMGMGMGLGTSRISPDTSASARAHGFYSSEYRSFNNRGFGRGQGHQKSFQQPPPPPPLPRRGDILMEAGRLAAEYLVSKGLLPQTVLSAKCQNGSFKKQVGDYQDFRQQEDQSLEGRTSAHARLGFGASDTGAGAGRRRYSDDFNSRNHVKGRRRGEYYRSYSSEWGRDYVRSGSLQDRNRVSPDMELEDDPGSGHLEELQVGNDVVDGMHKSGTGTSGLMPENQEAADVELGQEKYDYPDDMVSKPSSSVSGKHDSSKDDTDGEPFKGSVALTKLNLGNGEMKDGNYKDENGKQIALEDFSIQHSAVEGDLPSKNGSDLLTLCKFAKVPTKVRSALTYRASKVDQVRNSEEENALEIGPAEISKVVVQEETHDVSPADGLANATTDSNCPNSEVSKLLPVKSAEDAGEICPANGAGQGKCVKSQSFPDKDFMHDNEQESSGGLPGIVMSSPVKKQGEKRTAEDNHMYEAKKKPKEWIPSLATKAEEHLNLSNLSENMEGSQEERLSSDRQVITTATQDSFTNSCQITKTSGEPYVKYAQEKQLFPSSFKTCDLNLMEASDMNDNLRNDPVLMYPTITTIEKEVARVDVDLSISNSNMSGEYGRGTSDSKGIEVIDLENESTPEDKTFDNSHRKVDAAFTGTEEFPSHTQNAGDISDVQDNYDGLMISEFLNTFSNCNSVPMDINPLQNNMGLHNVEGTLGGDDDSIYMSLGEIPLSFIPAWEQPTPQEYEKPF